MSRALPGIAKDEASNVFILNYLTGQSAIFPFISESYSEGESADFDQQQVRGRSNPFFGYASSGPRSGSFNVKLFDDFCIRPEGILATVSFLRSLVYPEYRANFIDPPSAYVRIGRHPQLKVVITSVNVNWELPMRNGIYIVADVSIDYSHTLESPYSASEVAGGA